MSWSLEKLFEGLHQDIERRLGQARELMHHTGTKGDASEEVWLNLLQTYLPERYRSTRAFVVDSGGSFSDQIDVVVYDRQYSPFMFTFGEQRFVPAESVYAVFEAKQEVNRQNIEYAQGKARSVRKLKRTSVDINTNRGRDKAQPPQHIIAGLLSLESGWKPAFGDPLVKALKGDCGDGLLDANCVATTGNFSVDRDGFVSMAEKKMAATAFLFDLIERLQSVATVRAMDISAYSKWIQ